MEKTASRALGLHLPNGEEVGIQAGDVIYLLKHGNCSRIGFSRDGQNILFRDNDKRKHVGELNPRQFFTFALLIAEIFNLSLHKVRDDKDVVSFQLTER